MRIVRGTRIAAGYFVLLAVLSLVAAWQAPAYTRQQVATVYSSMPLQGAGRPQSLAVVQGARLALEEAGMRAGPHRIRYISLDNSTARAGTWTPEATWRNARLAAQDESTVAYIGEFNSGASAISIPLLNGRLAQISPSNTAIGLTRAGPGADAGEPDKYYPGGRRAYFRLLPNDRVQAAALAAAMRDRGCRRVAILNDGEVYGAGVGALVRRTSRGLGLRVVHASRATRGRGRLRAGIVGRVKRRRPRCVAYTGITANGAVPLFRKLARALPRAQLFGSDGIAESGFADPREGGVPARVGRRVVVTVATVAPDALPESGRAMLQRYSAKYGQRFPDPYAVQGYEAMRLVLDAVAAVGPRRRAVVRWLHDVRNRQSVLGTYSFDRFGDTTIRDYGLYRIRGGELEWAGAVRAP
jgi:branched-chain amino acid transport system substrate-binding protein